VRASLNQSKSFLPSSPGLHTIIYEDFQSAQFLEDHWNNLLAKSSFPNIFLTWEWVTTWWKWFGRGDTLHLIVAFDGSEAVGILPLYTGKVSVFPGFRVKAIRLIGDGGPVFPDYLGPIVGERDVERIIARLSECLLENVGDWNIIKLSGVLPETKSVESFVNVLGQKFMTEIEEGERCPYQPLPSNYKAFVEGLASRRRESVRRVLRKAKKKYDIGFKCYTSVDSVDEAFSLLTTSTRKSLRGQNRNNGFNRSDYLGFHREVAKAFSKRVWLRLYILWFNEVPVAFIYGYFYNRVFWYYQTGFDLAYGSEGPGSIILQLVIESVIGEGAGQFDFLRGDEDYKFHFANHERLTKSISFFRKHGMIYTAIKARHRLSYFVHKIKNEL